MTDRILASYIPGPLVEGVYARLFDRIEVDDAWLDAVRSARARGTVVYVLRSLSLVDFLALDYLTKRHDLPRVRVAGDLGVWVPEPARRGLLAALGPRAPVGAVEQAVERGESAVLFLKRPPGLLESGTRGRIEGDLLVRALFDVQRRGTARVILMPQVFVWSRDAGMRGGGWFSALFGPNEWPGNLRAALQLLTNWRRTELRAADAVDLGDFLAREAQTASDDVLVRRLTYTLLRRLERERRAILGPARKPPERLREEVIRSPKLQKVIADMAGEGAHERAVITGRAREMLREISAEPDMNAIAALDQVVTRAASRMFSAVEVDEAGAERLRACAKEGMLVYLPSHKSHMDYVVLTWILYHHRLPLPLICAGDNLDFFPLGPVLRRAGGFFIRRSFGGDRLYAAVVDAYVRRMMREGSSLEVFLEGGRSRTGKLLSPKLGMLSLMIDGALSLPTRTTWFCPVHIGYERFVEEKAFVRELLGGDKPKETMRALVRSVDVVTGRYGRLSVQFGKPLGLAEVLRDIDPESRDQDLTTMTPGRRRAVVTRLAYRAMNEINAVTAVTPGALVATALLSHERRGLSVPELLALCGHLSRTLRREGARFSPSLADSPASGLSTGVRPAALREAADLFVRAKNLEIHRVGGEVIYVVPDGARMPLDLAKNGILHFFVSRALVATALLASPGPPLARAVVSDRVLALSRLFKYEFMFRADAPFERIFDEQVAAMEADGELAPTPRDDGVFVVPKDDAARAQIELYARLVDNFVEGYRVAARGLTALLRGALPSKDLVRRTIQTGERMFLAGEIVRREAVTRPLLENAFASFVDQGYLARTEDHVSLTPSYATASAVATIEARTSAMGVARPIR